MIRRPPISTRTDTLFPYPTLFRSVFEHRYDYRAEWMRFTATLAETGTETGGGGSNLYRRSAKALADLTGSPAALLMLPDAQGSFRIAETWQWPDALDRSAERRVGLGCGSNCRSRG